MKPTFDDVIGYEAIKTELKQIVDMVRSPQKYKSLGASLPKGILIHGDPGLGKTLLAEALIHETGLQHSTVKRTEQKNNVVEPIIRAFHYAKNNEPYIVFLDDLDKFANEDSNHRNAQEYVTVQACINEVRNKDVLVVATVNEMELLPDSLVRSGRFDRKIKVRPPSIEEAMEIIQHYIKGKPLAKDVDVQDIVKMVDTQSCAILETTLNEAAIYAGWDNCDLIWMKHIVEAVLKLQYQAPADYKAISDESQQKYALHEAGHLVVAETLQPGSVGFVTIRSQNKDSIKGFTHRCQNFEHHSYHVMTSLAGKVATEMRYSGNAFDCGDDLRKAYDTIKQGIVGNAACGYGLLGGWSVSEFSDARVEVATAAELERYSMLVKDILIRNGQLLDRVTSELKEKKYLLYSDIQRIKTECGIEQAHIV